MSLIGILNIYIYTVYTHRYMCIHVYRIRVVATDLWPPVLRP